MKLFYKLFLAFTLCVSTVSAQDENDASFVADWNFGGFWFPSTSALPTGLVNKQAKAAYIPTIDPAANDFVTLWNSITNPANTIGNVVGETPAQDKGATDFTGSFKTCYDDDNIYILLEYNDDSYTGNETYELMWAPHMKINATDISGRPHAWYARYVQFGAYKTTYNGAGFVSAMMVTGGANYDASRDINWGGSNTLVNATTTKVTKKFEAGASVIRLIISIPFTALTGDARPTFDEQVWGLLNGGKGITFDIKVKDVDAEDVLDGTTYKSAAYWWNSTNNNGYAYTIYSGYLANKDYVESGIFTPSGKNSVFQTVTSELVILSNKSDLTVFNSTGKEILTLKNADNLSLKGLSKGIYFIRANNESVKIIK